MKFGDANRATCQLNPGATLAFSPPPFAVPSLETSPLPNPSSDGERLDVGDVSKDLEAHEPSSPRNSDASIERSTTAFQPRRLMIAPAADGCKRLGGIRRVS